MRNFHIRFFGFFLVANYFMDGISEQDLNEMNIEILRNTLYKVEYFFLFVLENWKWCWNDCGVIFFKLRNNLCKVSRSNTETLLWHVKQLLSKGQTYVMEWRAVGLFHFLFRFKIFKLLDILHCLLR